MAIDPLGAAGLPRPDAPRTDGAAAGEALTPVAGSHHHRKRAAAATDQVELSTTAGTSADADIPVGTLDADRLRAIAAKIADGSYDDPAVMNRVAGKLME